MEEEINMLHRKQKRGGVKHGDVVEGERERITENFKWQEDRGRRVRRII